MELQAPYKCGGEHHEAVAYLAQCLDERNRTENWLTGRELSLKAGERRVHQAPNQPMLRGELLSVGAMLSCPPPSLSYLG